MFVCPLRFGAGVKNKLLEAMAMRKPIVATSLACEGLMISPGQDVFVADHESDFARKCVQLVEDKGARTRLGTMARLLAEQEYSWWKGVDVLEDVLAEVVESSVRAQTRRDPREVFRWVADGLER